MDINVKPDSELKPSIVRVGDGRGFIVHGKGDDKLIITAGHCLPAPPPCMNFSDLSERTYRRLIGPIGQKTTISAQCLFFDPINDLAVLAAPDDQELFEEYEAYERFTEPLASFSTDDIPATPFSREMSEGEMAWVLSLSGKWQPCRMRHHEGPLWLSNAKIEGGMSGSPILSSIGYAVGVIVSNQAQPRLWRDLPGWIFKAELKRAIARSIEQKQASRAARKPAVKPRRRSMGRSAKRSTSAGKSSSNS